MKNEDELMIALDLIKTYSDAAQLNGQHLNDAIKKIENVRSDIIRTAQSQAKEMVKSELSEPLAEFNKQSDAFWNDSKKIIHALNDQVENNKWKHTFIFSISAAVVFGIMVLAIFMWIPNIDEIKSRRADYKSLLQYGFDISNCDGKKCVKVETNQCPYGENRNYCVVVVK